MDKLFTNTEQLEEIVKHQNKYTELFTLGSLHVSDFIEQGTETNNIVEMKMMLNNEDGTVRLEKVADQNTMYGKYWYRSGINATMKIELKNVIDSITNAYKLKENDIWIDIACFPEGHFINTKNGLVDIKDIKIGDLVLSHDDKYHSVIKLYNREFDGEYVKLKLKGLNLNTKMTHNHPVLTNRGWVEAGKLEITDLVSLRSGLLNSKTSQINLYELLKEYEHFIEDCGDGYIQSTSNGLKNKLPKSINIDNSFAEVLGYYIGEGSGNGGAGVQFSFHKKEIDKANVVKNYMNEVFNINTEFCFNDKKPNDFMVRSHSRPLSFVFEKLCGYTAKNKQIPTHLLTDELIPTFLKSLWFTDGHFSNHRTRHGKYRKNYVFNSISKRLVYDLWNLLESLEIKSSIQFVKNDKGFSKKDGKIYRLTVERNESVNILERIFNGEVIKTKVTDRFVKILDIEKITENHSVYNFEVEGSNSYICDGITVHNCNDGTLLSQLPKNLIRVGIDPADDSFKEESSKHADLIIQDFFNKEAYKKSKFGKQKAKVITSIAMFYDLEDPDTFIKDIHSVLDKDGLWVMQLSYTPLMIKQMAFDNICHEHVYYYSLFNLQNLLLKNGFKIVDCSLNDVNGGSFRVFIMKEEGDIKKFGKQPFRDVCQFRINSLLEYEKTLKLDKEETWTDFFKDINSLKEKTVKFIKEAKANGKKVWGYGASTKGNTLLQYFGLDSNLIDGIAERSPYKWGLKTVGTNIPIYSEDEMRKEKPDYLLVLPWHFINEFVERESDFLKAGGKFIVPCPTFEIIGL